MPSNNTIDKDCVHCDKTQQKVTQMTEIYGVNIIQEAITKRKDREERTKLHDYQKELEFTNLLTKNIRGWTSETIILALSHRVNDLCLDIIRDEHIHSDFKISKGKYFDEETRFNIYNNFITKQKTLFGGVLQTYQNGSKSQFIGGISLNFNQLKSVSFNPNIR
jgi:hypothetical protein